MKRKFWGQFLQIKTALPSKAFFYPCKQANRIQLTSAGTADRDTELPNTVCLRFLKFVRIYTSVRLQIFSLPMLHQHKPGFISNEQIIILPTKRIYYQVVVAGVFFEHKDWDQMCYIHLENKRKRMFQKIGTAADQILLHWLQNFPEVPNMNKK